MEKRNIVVIGASAGGFEALRQLVRSLPAGLDAAIFIVWHISPDVVGVMPKVLNSLNTLPAANAVNGEPVVMGRIYVAPPDHHLLIDKDCVRITRGPRENRFRPAVDPLFRSAAKSYGPRVIGIILSGALDDGTAGLWIIKQFGGLAVVQDPGDAEVPSMPKHALQAVDADYVLPIAEMGALLADLVQQDAPGVDEVTTVEEKRVETEITIAMEPEKREINILKLGQATPFTCPECHGVLTSLLEGGRMRFRCHTGHAFSADALLASISESIEDSLWNAVRTVQESVMFLNHLGDHFAEMNQPKLAAMYFKKAKEADRRASIVRSAALNHEQLSTERIAEEAVQFPGENLQQ